MAASPRAPRPQGGRLLPPNVGPYKMLQTFVCFVGLRNAALALLTHPAFRSQLKFASFARLECFRRFPSLTDWLLFHCTSASFILPANFWQRLR